MKYRPAFDIDDKVRVSTRSPVLPGEYGVVYGVNIIKTWRGEVHIMYLVCSECTVESGSIPEQDLEAVDE